jgi:hypothetical protein
MLRVSTGGAETGVVMELAGWPAVEAESGAVRAVEAVRGVKGVRVLGDSSIREDLGAVSTGVLLLLPERRRDFES